MEGSHTTCAAKPKSPRLRGRATGILPTLCVAAVAAQLLFCGVARAAENLPEMTVSTFIIGPADYTAKGGQASYQSQYAMCADSGATMFSDPDTSSRNSFGVLAAQMYPTTEGWANLNTFLATDAVPMPNTACTTNCVQRAPRTAGEPTALDMDSWNCGSNFYTGFWDQYSAVARYQPYGCGKYGMPNAIGVVHIGNYQPSIPFGFVITFNTSKTDDPLGWSKYGSPTGYWYFMTALDPAGGAATRIDSPEVAVNNWPLPTDRFAALCTVSAGMKTVGLTLSTTPWIGTVIGYKDLTWAQKHWWVIFLIIAIIILLILLAIMIYCYCTTRDEKSDAVAPMVMRERCGNPYVYVDGEDSDGTSKSRSIPSITAAKPAEPMPMPEPEPCVPMEDPEDMEQATPQIFLQEDTMLTADSDSMASDDSEADSEASDESSEASQ